MANIAETACSREFSILLYTKKKTKKNKLILFCFVFVSFTYVCEFFVFFTIIKTKITDNHHKWGVLIPQLPLLLPPPSAPRNARLAVIAARHRL